MERREFCLGAASAAGLALLGSASLVPSSGESLLRPPGGYSEERLIGACIRCDRCRSGCPRHCISLGVLEQGLINVGTPVMNFTFGSCDFCENDSMGPRCVRLCPTGALALKADDNPLIGRAFLDADECVHCGKCVPACTFEALTWDETTQLPIVDENACNGCGACEFVCPSASYGYYVGASHRAISVRK